MVEPLLELEPYEVSPQYHPLTDGEPFFFRARWFGEEREFVGKTVTCGEQFCHMWFRLSDEPERGNFVCANQPRSKRPSCVPVLEFGGSQSPQAFVKFIEGEWWGRVFVLDSKLHLADGDDGFCTVFLAASGWGQVHFLPREFAEFQWSAPCHLPLAEPSPQRHLNTVLALNQTPHHHIRFAFEWAKTPKLQRLSLALPLGNGDYKDWQTAIRLYAVAFLSDREGWHYHADIGLVSHAHSTWLRRSLFWQQIGSNEPQTSKDNHFEKFLLWTRAHFEPKRNDELCTNHPCVRFYVDRNPTLFSDHFEHSTQHERLEARLQLREWLRDKTTPQKMESLLNEG